jgi:hypothetical protein
LNDTLLFAPKAIMNAVYVGEDRTIRGSDIASFSPEFLQLGMQNITHDPLVSLCCLFIDH